MKPSEAFVRHRAAVRRVVAAHRAGNARVFGSAARGYDTEDTEDSEPAFVADPLVQDAAIRNLEVPGEASRNIGRHAPVFARASLQLPLAAV